MRRWLIAGSAVCLLFWGALFCALAAQPTVRIYSPTNGTVYLQPTNVPLSVQILVSVDADFSARTDLYDGTNFLGATSLKQHHTVHWSNIAFGEHDLVAIHHASTGPITSSVVRVHVAYGGWALVRPGSVWQYLDGGVDPGPGWQGTNYDTSFWYQGVAKIGFGDDDVVTQVNWRNPTNGLVFPAYYFRRAFVVTNAAAHSNLAVRLRRDDGAIVYLNGEELFRDNMPEGDVSFWTYATRPVPDETSFIQQWINPARLYSGTNYLAVEVHNYGAQSEDIGFDLALVADIPTPRPTLAMERVDGTTVLSWPSGYEGFRLQTANSLSWPSNEWMRVTNQPTVLQGRSIVTNRSDHPERFFRLSVE